MRLLAVLLNQLSGGRASPNVITIIGVSMHLPIAFLIASSSNLWAALLLVVFGLFDTLDGELARLQYRANRGGMVLDATTDRFKEVLLYCGAAYALIGSDHPYYAVWAVAACGFSISVSYVKAKGESAITESGLSANQKNKTLFRDGLVPFEVRMFLLVIALLTNWLGPMLVLIAGLAAITAIDRLVKVMRHLRHVQD
jgi:phosphatidylglycerophosphate synthase